MKRIGIRAMALWMAVLSLAAGIGFFLNEYVQMAQIWAMEAGNPNLYQNGHLSVGTVVDRQGLLLSHYRNGKQYSPNTSIRMSTLHWIGDRAGNVADRVSMHYKKEITGYDWINGLYQFGGIGGTLIMTISGHVQAAALEAMGERRGTIAVCNYRTGELLCALSSPTFDPEMGLEHFPSGTEIGDGVYMNRFLHALYIPGSIFKIVTTAAALEELEGIRGQKFTCTGSYPFGPDKVTCQRAHGTLDIQGALMRSCNCIFAQIAMKLGRETMEAYVKKFGVTEPTAFDGFRTVMGNYEAVGAADIHFAWSAVGQHKDQMNPCSFLTFISAIANGGEGVEPYIVAKVTAGQHETYRGTVKPRQRILSEETAKVLQGFMRYNVVSNYGAEHFPGLTVCAKSGTGEVGGGRKPNAMFAGFVADEQYPLAFFVAVEDGGSGKTVCVPILSRVLAECKALIDSGSI